MSVAQKTGGVRNIADVADVVVQGMKGSRTESERLSDHPGAGRTHVDFGLHRLYERAGALGLSHTAFIDVERRAHNEFAKGSRLCESPIERSMLGALITAPWQGFLTIPAIVHDGADKEEMFPEGDIVIVPQMAFLRYRLDFGIIVEINGARRFVCVECDGAAFHQDAKRERLREQYLLSWGFRTFNFTGAEIYEDAIACADRVVAGISRWRDGG